MSDSGLYGPFTLSNAGIDASAGGVGPGAYLLGAQNAAGGLSVRYAGRSDTDLNGRLKQHVGKYTHFMHAYYQTAKDAYAKECWLYHEYSPPDNQIHPAAPQSNMKCAICGT